ncbi:D-alanyl-D-alanine carboxypeptidase (penicillin-binding protein 5/6) [Herbihabitans rhizosphaerae]|uniref:D-alanyl-D-alanine carboxypeptidase (Penicillin-binding protein 5/6) n=1 Tax=Herbihabitans rhizosphaerae TaxID=1872711 RepID=A0A4Q7KKA4_9PSEU|nr:D-alanyl-D-alanine carboxypeptidase family protein [Herbihabitans rhizosphaerae]RZS36885.1 D-alanyl-D-alanine carboxypeptidase (penicillin-binding protein 5/6) [Herbihabitans rhizosphaerae]
MRFTARRSAIALLFSLSALLIAALIAAPGGSAQPQGERSTAETHGVLDDCPPREARETPPPPVDTSEVPKPGTPPPAPLPVPDEPVGGNRMGECGVVRPEGTTPPPGELTSAAWMVADVDTGQILAARDPHTRHRPASVIKTLLAIVAIRELNPRMVISGTQEDANQEGTKVGVGPGGQYPVHLLLQAMVMRSGNDAAHALARALGGVPAALEKMNSLAKALGATDTRAATPSGLDGPGMSTSAYDVALLFRTAMRHHEFAEAVATKALDFPGYAAKPGYKLFNDNKLLGKYTGFLGGKTGFTDDARHTYVGAATRDGRRLVAVVLRTESKPVHPSEQAAELLSYGFTLARQGSGSVGQLVERAPQPQPKPGSPPPVGETTSQAPVVVGEASNDPNRSAFGNMGVPLFVIAGFVVAIAVALWLRRQKAKRARLARQSATP